jgi:hypothetical protein
MMPLNRKDAADLRRPGFQCRRWSHRILAVLSLVSMVAAAACYISYRRDCARLRGIAQTVTAGLENPAERVVALLHWVYRNQSTTENPRHFLLPRLRATPCQVLETGGDCADKSRLLSALLREVEIPASMAMCFDPRTGRPTHTVVVASIAQDREMVVDPVYELSFPKPQHGDYYGLLDLRKDPTILTLRLEELRTQWPRSHPVHSYDSAKAGYSRASCINWERDALTRLLGSILIRRYGNEAYTTPRPVVLEEPKLAVAVGALSVGIVATAASGVTRPRTRARSSALPRSCLTSYPPSVGTELPSAGAAGGHC